MKKFIGVLVSTLKVNFYSSVLIRIYMRLNALTSSVVVWTLFLISIDFVPSLSEYSNNGIFNAALISIEIDEKQIFYH